MKKGTIITLVFLFLLYLVYFRWFAFSHSIKGDDIHINLPDFIDKNYLKQQGFDYDFEHYISWYKKGLFNFKINNHAITDSLFVEITTTPKEYPLVNRLILEADATFITKLTNFIDKTPDSTKIIVDSTSSQLSGEVLSHIVKYYTINSNIIISISKVKYRDVIRNDEVVKNKQPDKTLVTILCTNKRNWFYHFISRLPFFVTLDPFVI